MKGLKSYVNAVLVMVLIFSLLPPKIAIASGMNDTMPMNPVSAIPLGATSEVDGVMDAPGDEAIEEDREPDTESGKELEKEPEKETEKEPEKEIEKGDVSEPGTEPETKSETEPETSPETEPETDAGEDAAYPENPSDTINSEIQEPESFDSDLLPVASDQDFSYTTSDDGVTITGYTGAASSVDIPEMLGGYPVVAIGDNAFSGKNHIESVILPSSVKTIGNYAFQRCAALQNISLNNGLISIGHDAFKDCTTLRTLTFTSASTLSEIGDNAFYGCTALTSIKLPDSLRTLGNAAFQGCSALQMASLGNGLLHVGYEAFSGCTALIAIVIPDSVTTLDVDDSDIGATFMDCISLTSVTLGNGLTAIPQDAFSGCTSLNSVTIGSQVAEIGANAFFKCTSLKDVNFHADATLETIARYAFSECKGLIEVVLPNSVRTIEQNAFRNCESLTNLTLNDGLVSIGYEAFRDCISLTSVVIPDSVTTLNGNDSENGYTFRHCINLTTVTLGDGLTTIPAYTFYECWSLKSILIGGSVSEIGNNVFNGCTSLEIVDFQEADALNTIGDNAFDNCTGILSITLPANLKALGNHAFRNCTALQTVDLNDGLETIGYGAFLGCTSLTSIVIPDSVITLNNNSDPAGSTFENCTSLSSVVIGSGLQVIPDNAFWGCEMLSNVVLGDNVSEIRPCAFYACTDLRSITFGSALKTIGDYAFFQNTSLSALVIPSSVTSIGNGAFQGCKGLISLHTGDNVAIIASSAFRDNTSLENLTIGAATTMICRDAFRGNTALKTVEFPSSLQQIEECAFQNCTSLLSATIPAGVLRFGNGISAGTAPGTNIFTNTSSKFTVIGVAGSPAEEFAINNGYPFALMGGAISLEVDATTNTTSIRVAGSASAGSHVFIYDGGTVIGTFVANLAGRYGGSVRLNGGYGLHLLTAKSPGESGTVSTTQKVYYEQQAPSLISFTMYHNGRTISLITGDGIRQVLFFSEGSGFTFEVRVANSDQIKAMYICSERSGVVRTLKASYDPLRDRWLASGFFDPADYKYVPGKIYVRYVKDYSDIAERLSSIDAISESDWTTAADSLSAEWKDAAITIEENTANKTVVNTVLNNAENTSYTTTYETAYRNTAKTPTQLMEEGYAAVPDVSGGTAYVKVSENAGNAVMEAITFLKSPIGSADSVVTWATLNLSIAEVVAINAALSKDFVLSGAYGRIGDAFDITQGTIDFADATAKINAGAAIGQISPDEAEALIISLTMLEAGTFFVKNIINTQAKSIVLGLPLADGAAFGSVGVLAGGCLIDKFIKENIYSLYNTYDWVLAKILGCNNGAYQIAIDPSGYVYEAVSTNRLEGATVTVYYKDEDGDAVLWDAFPFEQANPLITDHEGRYAWDVPEGLWQVEAELAGYETTYSEWLPVPPPQTDVNIAMVSKAAPEIAWFNAYDTYAEVEFTKYLKPETVYGLLLKAPNGTEVAYSLDYAQDEQSLEGQVYAKRYKLIYANGHTGSAGTYSLTTAASILSYADVPAKMETKQAAYALPVSVVLPERVEVAYGGTADVAVTIKNYNPANPLVLTAESDFNLMAEVVSVGAIDADGTATVKISGYLPGDANIIFRIADKGIEEILPVTVNFSDSEPVTYQITVKAGIGGAVSGGGTYASGAEITLTATPSAGYAFDGWYEDNIKIDHADETYVITVTEHRTLEARFTKVATEWAGRIANKNQGRVQYGEPVEGLRVVGAYSPDGGSLSYEWWWTSYDRAGEFGYIGTTYGEDTAMPAAALTTPGMYKIEAKVVSTKDGVAGESVMISTNVWIVSTPVISDMAAAADTVAAGQPIHLNATVTTQDHATMFYWWHRTNLDTGEFKRLGGANGWFDSNVYTDNEALAPGTYKYELLVFSVRFIFTDVPEEQGSIIGNGYANPDGISDGSFTYSEDGTFYYGGTWSSVTGQAITVQVY